MQHNSLPLRQTNSIYTMCDVVIARQDTFDKLNAFQLDVVPAEDLSGLFDTVLEGVPARNKMSSKSIVQAPVAGDCKPFASTWRSDYFDARIMNNRTVGMELDGEVLGESVFVSRRACLLTHNRTMGALMNAESSGDPDFCFKDSSADEEEEEELEFEVL